MVAGLGFLSKNLCENKTSKVLILGGGAGIMSKFMYYNLPNVSVDAVEISENVIEIGKRYFEWPQSDRHNVIHGDALEYVKTLLEKHGNQPKTDEVKEEATTEKEQEEHKTSDENATTNNSSNKVGLYDVIIIDINDSSAGSKLSPPKEFLSQEFLTSLKRLLTDSGVLMMNIIPMESAILDNCLKDINKVFDVIYLAKPETEVNYVAFMLNIDIKREKIHDGTEMLMVEENMIPSKKDLEIAFKTMAKTLNVKWDATMNLDQYCGEIVLKFPLLKAGRFQMTNVQIAKGEGEYTSVAKEMYLEDKEKVEKSQRKKKKNKKR